jgi:phosphoribosylformimino-5-aminoimidazole carboxamide ribotide isomerase
MDVIPVLDLRDGVVVHAVGGRRREYRPVQSALTSNPSPVALVGALRERFGFSTIYLADLDGLTTGRPHFKVLAELLRQPFRFLVDAGCRTMDDAVAIAELGADRVVIASESLRSPAELERAIQRLSAERIVFSMDLGGSRPVVAAPLWKNLTVEEVVNSAAIAGVANFILLDIADVGEGRGISTLPLLESLRARHPKRWFAVGGGVRDQADLDAARLASADAVLLASALHDGRYPFATPAPFAT